MHTEPGPNDPDPATISMSFVPLQGERLLEHSTCIMTECYFTLYALIPEDSLLRPEVVRRAMAFQCAGDGADSVDGIYAARRARVLEDLNVICHLDDTLVYPERLRGILRVLEDSTELSESARLFALLGR